LTENEDGEQPTVIPQKNVSGYSLGIDRFTLPVVRRAKAMQVELKRKRQEGTKAIGMGDVNKLGDETRVEHASA